MQGKMVDSRVPTLREIGSTLREEFKLRYRKEDGAAVRYRDPAIDARRVWASRILAHMMVEDYLVISIDETHIRSDKYSHYAWQFVANERPFMKVLLEGAQDEQVVQVDDNESDMGEISSEISQLSVKSFSKHPISRGLPGRKRGRPRKEGPALPPKPKGKRGRPRKEGSVSSLS